MVILYRKCWGILILSFMFLISCESDSEPITLNSTVVISSSYESVSNDFMGTTLGIEKSLEDFLNVPSGSLSRSASITDEIEFVDFNDIYDVDISETAIRFVNIVSDDNLPYPGYFRVIEEGTFYRYSLDFNPIQNFIKAIPEKTGIRTVLSNGTLLIEIGPGYQNDRDGFTITVE